MYIGIVKHKECFWCHKKELSCTRRCAQLGMYWRCQNAFINSKYTDCTTKLQAGDTWPLLFLVSVPSQNVYSTTPPLHWLQTNPVDHTQCQDWHHLPHPNAGVGRGRALASQEIAAVIVVGVPTGFPDALMVALGSCFESLSGKDVQAIWDMHTTMLSVGSVANPAEGETIMSRDPTKQGTSPGCRRWWCRLFTSNKHCWRTPYKRNTLLCGGWLVPR
jgi:hypothetical protein